MKLEKKECIHIAQVLKETQEALKKKNSLKLKDLSNDTIHSACSHQDSASITIATIIYSLSKIIERDDYARFKSWDLFVKKFNAILDLAIKALNEDKLDKYNNYIRSARKALESNSVSLKPYIQNILKKASINKGSKIYEHGISLEQTAKLLGISQWELSDYIGQRDQKDHKHGQTIDVKKRVKIALEFFQ
jgi:hypothetical protein